GGRQRQRAERRPHHVERDPIPSRAPGSAAWAAGGGGTIGARQVQNAGTVGGNLCNASPAADGVPPLLTLDASVEPASVQGKRRLSLSDFLLGPRQTALQPGELLTAVEISVPPPTAWPASPSWARAPISSSPSCPWRASCASRRRERSKTSGWRWPPAPRPASGSRNSNETSEAKSSRRAWSIRSAPRTSSSSRRSTTYGAPPSIGGRPAS